MSKSNGRVSVGSAFYKANHIAKEVMMKPLVLAIALVLAFSVSANALIITYDNKTDFLADTAAKPTLPFPDRDEWYSGGPALNLGELTFSAGSLLFFTEWTPLIDGYELAINGVEDLDIDAASPIYSLGFDFVERIKHNPYNLPIDEDDDSVFEVTLYSGGTLVDSFSYNAPNDVLAFVGVWSDSAFDGVEIRETFGGIGDEYFGQFYTGTNPVPEPATILLIGTGLVGLVGFRKKLRK